MSRTVGRQPSTGNPVSLVRGLGAVLAVALLAVVLFGVPHAAASPPPPSCFAYTPEQATPGSISPIEAVAGATLTSSLGTWTRTGLCHVLPSSYDLEWFRDGTLVATESYGLEEGDDLSYTTTSADVDHTITAEVEGCTGVFPNRVCSGGWHTDSNSLPIYESPLGLRREYTDTAPISIDDQESMSVNVANGNLILQANDFQLPGIAGFGYAFTRYYNSLYSNLSTLSNPTMAPGWEDLPDIAFFSDGDARYAGDSGYEVTFHKSGSSFVATPGIDATFVLQTGGTYLLTFYRTGMEEQFSSTGQLLEEIDRNGNMIAFTWSGSQLSSVTDTTGRTTSFTYTSGRLTGITDAAGRTYGYTYDSGGNLATYTDADGDTTTYSYNSAGLLSTVKNARGYEWQITYDSQNRVTAIEGGLNSSGSCPTGGVCPQTNFAYGQADSIDGVLCPNAATGGVNPTTHVTDPNGNVTRYCFDGRMRAIAVRDPLGNVTTTNYTNVAGGSNCTNSSGYTLDDEPCSTVDPLGNTTTYGYDTTGQNTVFEQNPLQNSTHRSSWAYTDGSHPYDPTSYVDADGNTTTYTYTTAGNPATKTDGVGNETSYTYNSNGEPASKTDGLNSSGACPTGDTCPTTTYNTYDSYGDLTEETDGLGHVTSYTYDSSGNQTGETDGLNSSLLCPSGNTCPVTSETYDADGRLLSETNPNNFTTQYTFDAAGNETNETDGLSYNSSTHVFYCPSGSTCPGTSKTYDANNRLLSETDPNSHTTQYTYDANGNMLTDTDPDGNQTLYAYDGANDQTSERSGLNSSGSCPTGDTCPTTTYVYDANGNQIGQVDPDGYGSHSAYDAADELTSEQDGLTYSGLSYSCASGDTCPTTTYGYDLAGNRTTVLDGNSSETATTYDADNRAHTVTSGYQYDSGSHTYDCLSGDTCPETTYTYDNNGNEATVTDPDGNQTSYLYNADNQVSSVTSGLNSSGVCPTGTPTPVCPETTYTYDNVGNESTVEKNAEPGTPTTTYTYYADGSLDTTTDPMGNVTTDSYDNVGNLISEQTPKGTTTSCYDAAGELLSTYYSAATCGVGTSDVSYSYDAAGNRHIMSTTGAYGQITETTQYTNLEQPLNVTTSEPINGSTLNAEFQYGYNANGDVTERTYPDGTNVYYAYNNRDLLCRVGSASGSSCSAGSDYVAYSYDGDNNLTTSTHPSGSGNFVETRTWDNAERLTGVDTTSGSNTIADTGFTLDPSGDPTSAVRTGWNPVGSNWSLSCTITSGYDNNERLTSSTYSSGTNGCPTQNSDAYSFSWNYDADGNWTQSAGTATTYYKVNADDQICATSTGSPPSSCGSSFTYDGNGNETTDGLTSNTYAFNGANQMTSATAQGATSTATHDGDGKQLSQTANGTTTYYFWDTNTDGTPQLALTENSSGTVTARYIYGIDRLSVTSGGSTQYYIYDSLGSPSNLVSTSGVINTSYLYDPYGALRYSSGSSPAMTFAGLRSSSVSNLDEASTRNYDTNTGRFLSQDPAGTASSDPSTYSYSGDNPATYIDPTGESFCNPILCGGGGGGTPPPFPPPPPPPPGGGGGGGGGSPPPPPPPVPCQRDHLGCDFGTLGYDTQILQERIPIKKHTSGLGVDQYVFKLTYLDLLPISVAGDVWVCSNPTSNFTANNPLCRDDAFNLHVGATKTFYGPVFDYNGKTTSVFYELYLSLGDQDTTSLAYVIYV